MDDCLKRVLEEAPKGRKEEKGEKRQKEEEGVFIFTFISTINGFSGNLSTTSYIVCCHLDLQIVL